MLPYGALGQVGQDKTNVRLTKTSHVCTQPLDTSHLAHGAPGQVLGRAGQDKTHVRLDKTLHMCTQPLDTSHLAHGALGQVLGGAGQDNSLAAFSALSLNHAAHPQLRSHLY